ncbi:PAAR domain-containing protein [Enterobacter wuhouensis]|uniref:PAAR domain-containing protein n=1 Tax=Enterobacter wuhouensis TaxID=2529381 RepID=UPI002FD675C4
MSIGFWVVKGDKTTCGGSVLTGHPKGKQIGPNLNRQATVGCQVSCGKHPGTYSVAGGYPGEYIHGQLAASTIYSRSTCPCKSFFIATHTFMKHGPYQAPVKAVSAPVAAKAVSEPVQEPEQHAQVAKKQNSFADTCKPEDNQLLNGVYIWTEITDAGHAFVSVHENNSIYVYTYGRFGRRGPANFTGDGILNFFTGDDARSYYREELYKVNARVFKIDDASRVETRSLFENLWNSGAKPIPTEKMGERTKRRGRVIDVYDLTGSNCTTHTVQVIRKSGSNIFATSYTSTTTQLPIEGVEDFAVPLSLQNYLMRKSSSLNSMQVTEVTNEFKEQYPNIDNYTLGEENAMEKNLAVGASTLGSASGYSGGTVGGFLGGSYDLDE